MIMLHGTTKYIDSLSISPVTIRHAGIRRCKSSYAHRRILKPLDVLEAVR
jgi:hypothetical protein